MAVFMAAKKMLVSCDECKANGQQEQRYCDKDSPTPLFEFDGELFFRCPVSFILEESFIALNEFSFFSKGFLPVAGGWEDQPHKIMQQMLIIDSAFNEVHSDAHEKRKS